MPPVVDHDKCIECGLCVEVCSEDVFGGVPEYPLRPRYQDECWHCASCVIDCPTEAIKLYIPLPMRL